jgi:hypothetical protein
MARSLAYAIDWKKFARRVVHTGHFALYALAFLLWVAHRANLIPATGVWHQATDWIAEGLGILGYGLGAAWSPPRRPLTEEERAEHGLPPAAPAPSSAPPPLPPAG